MHLHDNSFQILFIYLFFFFFLKKKSETCGLQIPEIELELTSGTLGGRFTTVEGLLTQVYEELAGRAPFASGDSALETRRKAFEKFLAKLQTVCSCIFSNSVVIKL